MPQVARVYFTQYHLHLQLLEASKYAESLGVALKGDLPIGVTRCSQVPRGSRGRGLQSPPKGW